MLKFYKHHLYKKYRDELWGKLISSNKFSFNRRSILLNYKNTLSKRSLKIKTKFNYFRKDFLRRLRDGITSFQNVKLNIRLLSFCILKIGRTSSEMFTDMFFPFSRTNNRFNVVDLCKIYEISNKSISSGLIKLNFMLPFYNLKKNRLIKTNQNIYPLISRAFVNKLGLYSKNIINFNPLIKGLKFNYFKFIVNKCLNLSRQEVFSYSVHISSPQIREKKHSLFAMKIIYYKKISLFFGFKKMKNFIKLYKKSSKIGGLNDFALFLGLEGRLETFLLRLNFFPSTYFINKFILHGNTFVNNRLVTNPSYIINFNEIISISKKYFKMVYYHLKFSLKTNILFLNNPSFIEADYKLLIAMLIRNPNYTSLTMPVSFELYTQYASFHR